MSTIHDGEDDATEECELMQMQTQMPILKLNLNLNLDCL